MISVRDAQQKILETVSQRESEEISLKEALGCIIAKEIASPLDMPSFDNSAMDGYALRVEDTISACKESPACLTVTETISAGTHPQQNLKSGEAMRIFTGAMIPPGANAVVKQEDVLRQENKIAVGQTIEEGDNIRIQGEELKQGEVVFNVGEVLSPAGIGWLASLGIREIRTFAVPRVGILVTGSEIVEDPAALEPGKVLDSNSFSLRAALQELYLTPSYTKQCPDQKEDLYKAVVEGLAESDFLIVTGGVSVGDFDFVKEVAGEAGIREIFWKVKQKPGKPIYFGKREDHKYLIGLPGNPASALVCFYEYVRPALLHSMGAVSPFLPCSKAVLRHDYHKKAGRLHFLRGFLRMGRDKNDVTILEKQGSHIMKSFARANCLVVIPEEQNQIEEGEEVTAHLLPSFFLKCGGSPQ